MQEYNVRESYNEPVKMFPSLVVTDIKHKRVRDRYLCEQYCMGLYTEIFIVLKANY